ncbi:hypothetical protein C8J57DRAFT_1471593 [Mycena rebaudengoi]|nr:hypothetical protein C8J57DRAFT_1471593 [Mycena rebaudengoi]
MPALSVTTLVPLVLPFQIQPSSRPSARNLGSYSLRRRDIRCPNVDGDGIRRTSAEISSTTGTIVMRCTYGQADCRYVFDLPDNTVVSGPAACPVIQFLITTSDGDIVTTEIVSDPTATSPPSPTSSSTPVRMTRLFLNLYSTSQKCHRAYLVMHWPFPALFDGCTLRLRTGSSALSAMFSEPPHLALTFDRRPGSLNHHQTHQDHILFQPRTARPLAGAFHRTSGVGSWVTWWWAGGRTDGSRVPTSAIAGAIVGSFMSIAIIGFLLWLRRRRRRRRTEPDTIPEQFGVGDSPVVRGTTGRAESAYLLTSRVVLGRSKGPLPNFEEEVRAAEEKSGLVSAHPNPPLEADVPSSQNSTDIQALREVVDLRRQNERLTEQIQELVRQVAVSPTDGSEDGPPQYVA